MFNPSRVSFFKSTATRFFFSFFLVVYTNFNGVFLFLHKTLSFFVAVLSYLLWSVNHVNICQNVVRARTTNRTYSQQSWEMSDLKKIDTAAFKNNKHSSFKINWLFRIWMFVCAWYFFTHIHKTSKITTTTTTTTALELTNRWTKKNPYVAISFSKRKENK